MKAKHFTLLAIVTLVVVVAAFFITQPSQQTNTTTSKNVFPHLLSNLKTITEIEVKTQEETFSIVREGEQWGLKDKHGYPVALDKVSNILLGMAELRFLEAKTKNPDLYSKIGVEDVTETNAQSVLLTLKKSGTALASLIVGHSQVAKTDTTLKEIYVRDPKEKQAWLAVGALTVDKKSADWLDKQIINVDVDKVRQVHIQSAEGEDVLIFKEKADEEDFQLADIPAGFKVKSPYVLRQVASALMNLTMNDVTIPSEVEFDAAARTKTVLTTFSGLEVTVTSLKKEDKHYIQLAAAYVEPPAEAAEPAKEAADSAEEETATDEQADEPETPKETKEQVQARVKDLNTHLKDWVFVIPDYKANVLVKQYADLIEEEKAEEPAGETGDAASILSPGLGHPNTLGNSIIELPASH